MAFDTLTNLPDCYTLKFNTRHVYVKKIGENIWFFQIINEDFEYSILFKWKLPNDHLVVYPHELQDGG